jgi:CheY-like chemotaxis protein
VITVSDTGAGMSPDVRQKAIEPFFTTKSAGKGTGLGLSMVYGFMRQSGGHLRIESEEGKGSRIRLYLRRADKGMAEERGEEAETDVPDARAGHGADVVLIVEDDPNVRDFAASVLGEAGYTVREAANAVVGLDILMRDAAIGVLVSDLVMPGAMTGVELARAALAHKPDLAVILTTGYADMQTGDWPADRVAFLAKPYRVGDIARAVQLAFACAQSTRARATVH